ncbi:unnamed protein product [Phaedon cochleariae]|uniref:Glucosidase II subunit alpha n=1 Tax=Phaedon cochleariae TaxID=80249 RepID=A0A9N9X7A4_PHACE|nr:unnamed protein product [Phaedon cochleariae]
MIRLTVFVAFLAASTLGADHNLFKNCSRISFCKELRNHTIPSNSLLQAQIHRLTNINNVANIPLTNSNHQELNLQISLLPGNKVRAKILEANHSRYELSDVLVEEPISIPFSSINQDNKELFLTPNDPSYHISVTILAGPPFSIVFKNHDRKEVILDGERIQIKNTNESQIFTLAVEFEGAKRLYGLHHHPTNLELPETADQSTDPFRLRNSDNANYEVGSPMALYGSVPVVYGHSHNSTTGIFLHNAAEQWVDISYKTRNPSAYFMVESGTLDLFILLGPTPKSVVRQFTNLTGVAHMPQLWTLGYHQCRWSYYTQEDVKKVVATMDANDFPMDAIWLDIDYTDGKRYFTWQPDNYSDPIELQRNLSSSNRKLVTILDPHIKVDENYSVYAQAKGKHFVKWANGSDFQGVCWPGLSSYIDFLDPAARDYYSSWYAYDKFKGSTETLAGIWNDMNEPSVFDDSLEKTLPFETIHHGGVLHRDIHNIYGFLQTMATHQGLMLRDNGTKRPFVLTRSHFAGSQRYAAMWTGDNTADWPYLQVSYSECILSNLMGLVFCGADVGGFFNNPDVELLQRWYQAGVWLPFYRGHAEETTLRREPYLFSKDVQDVIRAAIKLRYKHIPVWYTLFYEHTIRGDPVVRPLFYDYPGTVDRDDHILIGSNILARPVMESGVETIDVHFPGNDNTLWYRVDDYSWSIHRGGDTETVPVNITTAPFYYRGGSIIFRKDIARPSTTDMQTDPVTLYLNLDQNGTAEGTVYVDDYTSFEYLNQRSFFYLKFSYIDSTKELHIHKIDGDARGFQIDIKQIIIHRPSSDGKKKSSGHQLLEDVDLQVKMNEQYDIYLKL